MIDIQNILNLPEGRSLEFKRDLSSLKPILKTIVAFANTAGGILIIGRDDDGRTLGVDDIAKAEEKLANAISDGIYPPLIPEIETTSIKGKPLLLIRVVHWKGPFYLKALGEASGVYIRLGSTNRVAGPEILDELKRSFSKTSFDQLPCHGTNIDSLEIDMLKEVFSQIGQRINTSKLETLGLLVSHGGKLVCSNGGIILFGKKELREKYFPNTTVRCARFKGVDKVDFIDQYDVDGSIIEAMEEVPKFINRNTRLAAKIETMRRQNISEYPIIAVREVLTNALVHADYSIKGMNPRIMIYSDRLEIESPGTLPFGYVLDDFFAGVSHTRNKVIARVFRELHLMEEWGTGYRRIVKVCSEKGYPVPKWEELGTVIRVVFNPHGITEEVCESKELSVRQEKILTLLQKGNILSAKDVTEQLTGSVSERTVRLDLKELKNRGLIETVGKGPSTKWKKREI